MARPLQQRSSSFPCAGCKRQCASELLGTYLLVFLGPGSIVAASLWGLSSIQSLLFVAAVFGSTVASVILVLGRFSGAHINPAISVGSAVAGLLKRELFLPYLVFQVTGALLAGICLRLLLGAGGLDSHLGSTQLASGVGAIEGVSLEIIGTFFLALSALTAGSFLKSPVKQAIMVGGTLFVLILLIGPLTGASFNPARSLGPALLVRLFERSAHLLSGASHRSRLRRTDVRSGEKIIWQKKKWHDQTRSCLCVLRTQVRSQMAEAFARRQGLIAMSAGTIPGAKINPIVVQAMREKSIDISGNTPKMLTNDLIDKVDVVVTMGCSVEEVCPRPMLAKMRKKLVDWNLSDPKGKPIEEVRKIRDDIERRVIDLSRTQ